MEHLNLTEKFSFGQESNHMPLTFLVSALTTRHKLCCLLSTCLCKSRENNVYFMGLHVSTHQVLHEFSQPQLWTTQSVIYIWLFTFHTVHMILVLFLLFKDCSKCHLLSNVMKDFTVLWIEILFHNNFTCTSEFQSSKYKWNIEGQSEIYA